MQEGSQWTLDYPPMFAYLEWMLGGLAEWVDMDIVRLSKDAVDTKTVVIFSRLSVIMLNLVLFVAVVKFVAAKNAKKVAKENGWMIIAMVMLNFGLLIVDRIVVGLCFAK